MVRQNHSPNSRKIRIRICNFFSGEAWLNGDFYESGPYGSMNGGDWFTDFWQSLDGKR